MDQNRLVLYKKNKRLGTNNQFYAIEISTNAQSNNLYIAAYDMNSPESLLIELAPDKAKDILTQFNTDYEQMANALQVM